MIFGGSPSHGTCTITCTSEMSGQRIQRNILERPNAGENQKQCPREYEEAVVSAPINHAGNHGYIPPSALRLSCLAARTTPFLITVTVSCHVPPLSRFTWSLVYAAAFLAEGRHDIYGSHSHLRHAGQYNCER